MLKEKLKTLEDMKISHGYRFEEQIARKLKATDRFKESKFHSSQRQKTHLKIPMETQKI